MSREFSAAELKAKFPAKWKELQALAARKQKPTLPEKLHKKLIARAEVLARGKVFQVKVPEYGMIVEANLGWMDGDCVDLFVGEMKPLGKAPSRFRDIVDALGECGICEDIRELCYKKLRREVKATQQEINSVLQEMHVMSGEYDVDYNELEEEVDAAVVNIRDGL